MQKLNIKVMDLDYSLYTTYPIVSKFLPTFSEGTGTLEELALHFYGSNIKTYDLCEMCMLHG